MQFLECDFESVSRCTPCNSWLSDAFRRFQTLSEAFSRGFQQRLSAKAFSRGFQQRLSAEAFSRGFQRLSVFGGPFFSPFPATRHGPSRRSSSSSMCSLKSAGCRIRRLSATKDRRLPQAASIWHSAKGA